MFYFSLSRYQSVSNTYDTKLRFLFPLVSYNGIRAGKPSEPLGTAKKSDYGEMKSGMDDHIKIARTEHLPGSSSFIDLNRIGQEAINEKTTLSCSFAHALHHCR